MSFPAVSAAELAAGDGPYTDAATLFVVAGSCDQCGSTVEIADLEAGDDLCSRCRIALLLAAWLYDPMS